MLVDPKESMNYWKGLAAVQTATSDMYSDVYKLYGKWDSFAAKDAGAPFTNLKEFDGLKKDIEASITTLNSYKNKEVENFQDPPGKSVLKMFSNEAITGKEGKQSTFSPST